MDVSGRHEEEGEYLMVAAAVQATVGSTRVETVDGVGLATSRHPPDLPAVVEVAGRAIDDLPDRPAGPVVAERGEFYEEPPWAVGLQREFKYVESIAERETVQVAHHAAFAARRLLR